MGVAKYDLCGSLGKTSLATAAAAFAANGTINYGLNLESMAKLTATPDAIWGYDGSRNGLDERAA